jgi:nucleoid-associated protein YgaU
MARKKSSKNTPSKKGSKKISKEEILSSPASYRSLLFGIITVAVLFFIGISVFQFFQNKRQGEIDGGAVSIEEIDNALKNAGSYTVKSGDTLWKIAEVRLGSGFDWPKIADINNIKTPEDLKEGSQLNIPEIFSTSSPTPTLTENELRREAEARVESGEGVIMGGSKIAGEKYVIKRGDDLWDIAERAYGDPYRWVEIAEVNNLMSNPDLIHADNTLILPR